MTQLVHEIEDAAFGDDAVKEAASARTMKIDVDAHGCYINVEGVPESLVIDYCKGMLRVFVTNEHGDVQEPPVASLEVGPAEPVETQGPELKYCDECGAILEDATSIIGDCHAESCSLFSCDVEGHA